MTDAQRGYWQSPVEEQDLQMLLQTIQNTQTLFQTDTTVEGIVAEEAGAFCNGQCTAEEAAGIIQDRVQTVLDEQS